VSQRLDFLDERLPPRFWDKCIPEPNSGCWLWVASGTPDGYGQWESGVDGQSRLVHRISYEAAGGSIGDLELDHRCRVRCCCNPAHLEPVTHKVNSLRGNTVGAINAAKTECPRGHALTADNIYVERSNGTVIGRRCRRCKLDQQGARRAG
jgi:hypothetical protein